MEFRPYYLAREWIKIGHEVKILAADFSHLRQSNPQVNGKYCDEEIAGVHYIWCRTLPYHGNGLGRVLNIFSFLLGVIGWWLRLNLKHWRPEVVIASSTYPLDTIPAFWIAKQTGARLIYEVHDLWPLTPVQVGGMSPRHPFIRMLQWAENFGYRNADTVVSMLPYAKAYMVEHGMNPTKYSLIPNGIDVAEWHEQPGALPAEHQVSLAELKSQGMFLIGYTGGHGLANALDHLLDAAARLQNAPVRFLLVGDGPSKASLTNRAIKYGLTNVIFLSSIEKCSVPTFLAECDALYIGWLKRPIYRFGINPNKLLDYLMAGKPVIHSVDASNDIVSAAGAGISVRAEDPLAIADAVQRMLALSDEERTNMGAAGKAYVLKNHNYAVLARHFLQLL